MRRWLAPLLAVVATLQIFLAHRYYGFLTGDDVEVLEEAFRRAIGLRHQPWEIRNLFVPDVVVAPVVFVANALGVTNRRLLTELATLPFIALSLITIVLVYRLALKWTADESAAIVASVILELHWIPLGFGATVYPRTVATACIVGAALIVNRYPFAAGLLVAVAFADRFSEVVFLVPIFIVAPQKARVRLLGGAAAGLAIVGGAYDWLTWGAPFRSFIRFAQLTVVESDFASRVKYQPFYWYVANIARWCAPTLVILLFMAKDRLKPVLTLLVFILIPLLALSFIRHKEFRYLQGIIPFIAIGAGAGFSALFMRRRAVATALLAVSLLWGVHGLREFQRKTMPAVMAAEAIDRDPAIRTVGVPQGWAFGGNLFFHREVTLIEVGTPPREIPDADALALFRTELDRPELAAAVKQAGYVPRYIFRDPPARAVILLIRSASGTSGPARR
jgi:hypothetical protein